MYNIVQKTDISRLMQKATETTGLKWAPDIEPKIVIIQYSMQPVAIAFARRAIAVFPLAKLSPIIPLPTTLIKSMAEPLNSAINFFFILPWLPLKDEFLEGSYFRIQ